MNLFSGLSVRSDLVFFVFVFVSTVLATMVLANIATTAFDVRRRTVNTGVPGTKLRGTERTTEQETLTVHHALRGLFPTDAKGISELRKLLNLAGYYGRNAVLYFQAARLFSALVFGLATAAYVGKMYSGATFPITVLASVGMTLLGFYSPKSFVGFRRDRLREEHRHGFPEFLDLMVICADAGVGVDSAIDRISKDIVLNFPSLARNLEFMNLELRAGRPLRDAMENLGDRLGIDEARSFATLLQQSEELGSSLVQSLRVYSDEMRAKRLSRAEEKAHGLPAKLVLPLGLCVFPVILAITLLPVVLKIYKALGI